jgi:hypothetical protein
MTFVLSVEGVGSAFGGALAEVEGFDAKEIVRAAGLPLVFVRETVIGMAGLWYLSRGRQVRQNFLEYGQYVDKKMLC